MTPATRIRDRPGAAVVCAAISGINSGVAVVLSPALPLIARDLGQGRDGAFVAQIIQTLPAITMIAGAALAGYVSERLGRRMTLIVAVVLFAFAGAAGAVMPDISSLAFSRGVHGLAAGVMLTTSYATVGEYFTGPARLRMLGFCAASGSVFALLLLTISGQIVDHFGWRSAFLLFFGAAALLPVILASLHGNRPEQTEGAAPGWRPILAIWPLWLLQVAYTIGLFMSVVQVPFIAAASGIASAATIGLLVATTSATATLASLATAWLRRFMDFSGMFALISAAMGGGLLLFLFAPTFPLLMLAAIVLGIGFGPLEPTIIGRALDTTPTPLHERAAGAAISTLYLGQFLNPIVVHAIAGNGDVRPGVGLIGVAYLVAGCLFLVAATGGYVRRAKAAS